MEKETWENASKGKAAVLVYDRAGRLKHEIVRSGAKIQLTTDERLINMDRAATDKLDIFKNGTMTPLRIFDDVEDKAEIASNPNLKSESDLKEMFGAHWKTFQKNLSEISNVNTLTRLRSLAVEVDATVKQVAAIDERIAELEPTAQVNDVTVETFGEPTDIINPTTPK